MNAGIDWGAELNNELPNEFENVPGSDSVVNARALLAGSLGHAMIFRLGWRLGSIQSSISGWSIHSSVHCPRAANSRASLRQTPASPQLSMTRQKMHQRRGFIKGGAEVRFECH